jgi:3'-5' exoribonuclease
MVWDDIEDSEQLLREGRPVRVRGRYAVHPSYGAEIKLGGLSEAVAGSYADEDLRDTSIRPPDQMESDLRALLDTIHDRHLRALLEQVFDPSCELWARYRAAPAAKYYHQAYPHGLLEHCLGVAQAVSATASTFPGIDREVAVTGALLHDIGKLDAYTGDGDAVDLSDSGRLHGEIALGYYRIRRLIEDIPDFPEALAWAVLHIVLSHHGTLENGSPVVPCTREATLVHMIDNLGGRLGSFDRLQRELAPGREWSDFDRAIGAAAYFPDRGDQAPGSGSAADALRLPGVAAA